MPGFGKFSLVNFTSDGLLYNPEEYLEALLGFNKESEIKQDYYASGGSTAELEKAFAALTGKEKAVFLPTGTMANELAIKLLSAEKAKIVVPENSHIYRDEADAAYLVHNKRLLPAGKGLPYYDMEELDKLIAYHKEGEVFNSEVGAVALECPVRRADGTAVPLDVIRKVSIYCKERGYGLHLDGARLHLASAWTGVPISEYASYFDTVYISQYKYLNAAFGAVLCGPAELIGQIPHLVKIHGGALYHTWPATAMSLHHLKTIEEDLANTKKAAEDLVSRLNLIDGLEITPVPAGTNIYNLEIDMSIDRSILASVLLQHHNILMRVSPEGSSTPIKFNASILRRPIVEIDGAWQAAVDDARG